MSSDWRPPTLPDLRNVDKFALDTETRDEGIAADHGPGWPWKGGYVCGVSVAYRAEGGIRAHYFPLAHPDTENVDRDALTRWLKDLFASGVSAITKPGLYDYGWLLADLGVAMPPADKLEEVDAIATIVDENRTSYKLDDLCRWRNLPGKDEAELLEACRALGLIPKGRKKFHPQAHIWRLPARDVHRYAEQDTISTLLLFEDLDPVLDREDTRGAYQLDRDLMPMVHAMRRRGIRIDTARAEQVHDLMLVKRDAVLRQLSSEHGAAFDMTAIRSDKQLAKICDGYGIKYPRTEKGNPSFKAGLMGWMDKHPHWLPPLVANARRYDNSAKFVQSTVDHTVRGRVTPTFIRTALTWAERARHDSLTRTPHYSRHRSTMRSWRR
jgi:DNA polymerase I-like protein with 3'-5' exonuclease and polymerase domains